MGQEEWDKRNGTRGMGQEEWDKRNGTRGMGQEEWDKRNEKKKKKKWAKENGIREIVAY